MGRLDAKLLSQLRRSHDRRGRGHGDGEDERIKVRNILKRFNKWAYPECDHLNIALRFLLKNPGQNKVAIREIYFALMKTHGYFYEDVSKALYDEFKLSCRW